MNLVNLGYHKGLSEYSKQQNLDSFEVGRVTSEHKDRYTVKTETVEYDCELIGNLRYTATTRLDLPAVGDWVAISQYDNNKALIHAVYPRTSILERKAVGTLGQTQIIATNVDYGLIVQSINRDYSISRLERYLVICNAAGVEPIIVLSKVDLIETEKLNEILQEIKERIKNVAVFPISNKSGIGIDQIKNVMEAGKTYCLLGSSGVGKSTLLNTITGNQLMETAEISEAIDRGKHITTHRELIVLDKGIVIDNPGMREIGIADIQDTLELTFDEIFDLAKDCKYKDCTHTNESGCAVLDAIYQGELDENAYENYLKMEKERSFFESNAQERKKKDKDLGKLIKDMKKQKKNNNF